METLHTFGPKHLCLIQCYVYSECLYLPYSGKLLREKTFTNFVDLEPPAKVFSTKFEACRTHLWYVLAFRESFHHKMVTSYRSTKVFSLERFPLYGRVYFRGGGEGCFRPLLGLICPPPLAIGFNFRIFNMGLPLLRIWICPLLKFATMRLPPLERNPEINPVQYTQGNNINTVEARALCIDIRVQTPLTKTSIGFRLLCHSVTNQ